MTEQIDKPFGIRPTWRKWITVAEIEDMGQIRNYHDADGRWTGANLGITISGVRVRTHSLRSRRKDARWAARRGYVIDEKGIIRLEVNA